MATPKRFVDYPPEYSELLRRALIKPMRIPFPNEIAAHRFRNHLYAFRKAIRDDLKSPDDLILSAPLLSFKLERNIVLIYRKLRTSNLQKALEKEGVI